MITEELTDYFENGRYIVGAAVKAVCGMGLICDYVRGTTAPLHIWYRVELEEKRARGNEYPHWEFRRLN
jgi:hypothetical protein